MYTKLDDQLWMMQTVCNYYQAVDPLAAWPLYALTRYVNTGRATVEFERAFIALDKSDLLELVKACLRRDTSDDGMIRTAQQFLTRTAKR